MIFSNIKGARKNKNHYNQWYVLHPCNDSILFTCDSEHEADGVIEMLEGVNKIVSMIKTPCPPGECSPNMTNVHHGDDYTRCSKCDRSIDLRG